MSRARVREDIFGRRLEIDIVRGEQRDASLACFPDHLQTYTTIGDMPVEPPYPEGYGPLRLDRDDAEALFQALGKHFGLAPETASLRADYEAERKRVDVFIEHATKSAHEATMRRGGN